MFCYETGNTNKSIIAVLLFHQATFAQRYYNYFPRLKTIWNALPSNFIYQYKQKFIVGGNWKMNGSKKTVRRLFKILEKGPINNNTHVFVSVPTIYLAYSKSICPKNVELAAQNCYKAKKGAFTGETSPAMLKEIGVEWVILGHSDRRQIFKESNELVAEKVFFAKKFNLKVVACVGENQSEQAAKKTYDVIFKQIKAISEKLSGDWTNVVLAYEPVWAIRTGKTVTPGQVEEIHCALKEWICLNVCPEVADCVKIIYGGSVTGKNCKKLATQSNVDGFLVGEASLKKEFIKIINAKSQM